MGLEGFVNRRPSIVGKKGGAVMHFLYASKAGTRRELVATFDTEEQLLAYVGWATLKKNADGTSKFEQGSALAGFRLWESSPVPLSDEDANDVLHNPSPNML
jgi:hypothetical protein